MPDLEYRVKLRSTNNAAELVIFNVTPDLAESRTVNYKTVDPIHAPGQIYAFQNSMSRVFQISGAKLVSRTQEEAEMNLRYLWRLRGWTLPAFGRDPLTDTQRENRNAKRDINESFNPGSRAATKREAALRGSAAEEDFYGTDLRGSPPQVLELTAYAHDGHLGTEIGHINRVPVVITSLNIPYPSDVDYFPTTKGVPMPAIMTIDLTLNETHSPREYENFSLTDFKQGKLPGF